MSKDSSETQLCPLAHKKIIQNLFKSKLREKFKIFKEKKKVQGYYANIYLQDRTMNHVYSLTLP